jgi:predicted dehydrogenase
VPERFTVGVIGAGQIAQGFDEPGDPRVLSMANAISSSGDFALGGFYDIDPARAAAAETKWSCSASPRDRGQWLAMGWDVIYIATPDARHGPDLGDALACRPRAVLVEKPIALDDRAGRELLEVAARDRIPLLVNYPRRWHTGVRRVTDMISGKEIGAPLAMSLVCSGGIAHNGVHLLDLFRTWWGGAWAVRLIGGRSGSMVLRLESDIASVDVHLTDMPTSPYYLFEMRVYCERARVEVSGRPESLTIALARPDPVYPSFRTCPEGQRFEMEGEPLLPRALERLSRLIGDAEAAAAQLAIERESHDFIAAVLKAASSE